MNNVIDQGRETTLSVEGEEYLQGTMHKRRLHMRHVRRIMSGRRIPTRYPALHIMNGSLTNNVFI